MAADAVMVPHVMAIVAVDDVLGAHRLALGARIDAEQAIDATSDAADDGADNSADRTGHAVAFMESIVGAFGNALGLGGERERGREARGGDEKLEFHGSRPLHITGNVIGDDGCDQSCRMTAVRWRNCAAADVAACVWGKSDTSARDYRLLPHNAIASVML